MNAFTKPSLVALATVALLSACSRPYATFQKTTPEHFYTKTTATPAETPVVADASAIATEMPATTPTPTVAAADVLVPATAASVDADLKKVDALVSAKAGLSTNKKLTRHLTRVKAMVSEMRAKSTVPASGAGVAAATVAPHKMNLVQRLVTKSIDKKIQNKLAPKKPMAKSLLSIGLIIALIGLLLILIGTGTVYSLGYVGLIVGIILIIASLL